MNAGNPSLSPFLKEAYKRYRIETVLRAIPEAIMVLLESGGFKFVTEFENKLSKDTNFLKQAI